MHMYPELQSSRLSKLAFCYKVCSTNVGTTPVQKVNILPFELDEKHSNLEFQNLSLKSLNLRKPEHEQGLSMGGARERP